MFGLYLMHSCLKLFLLLLLMLIDLFTLITIFPDHGSNDRMLVLVNLI